MFYEIYFVSYDGLPGYFGIIVKLEYLIDDKRIKDIPTINTRIRIYIKVKFKIKSSVRQKCVIYSTDKVRHSERILLA